jgi:hypothetical protein
MEKKPAAFRSDSRELATRIYVDLVGRSLAVSDKGVAMQASAENLAKLSFKLSAEFQRVEDELNAENMPKNQGFTVESSDIAAWSK